MTSGNTDTKRSRRSGFELPFFMLGPLTDSLKEKADAEVSASLDGLKSTAWEGRAGAAEKLERLGAACLGRYDEVLLALQRASQDEVRLVRSAAKNATNAIVASRTPPSEIMGIFSQLDAKRQAGLQERLERSKGVISPGQGARRA